MKVIIQRVTQAQVKAKNKVVGRIGSGFLVFLGLSRQDKAEKIPWVAKKVVQLRIMSDPQGKMNKSLAEVGGQILVVSQFTLYADCQQGNRPSFTQAASPRKAEELYNLFIKELQSYGLVVRSGVFGAVMQVSLVNDGPVTIILEN
jgi:D-tyrosyl-tRNA(Tyr) deacylase